MESSSTNVYTVGEDLLRAFYKLFCLRFCVSNDQWKNTVARILQGILDVTIINYNSYKFSYKFDFIPVLSFRRNQKQESKFQQVGDLVTRNISPFCLYRLYFKAMPKSIDFYKDFLTCYSCSYYSSMVLLIFIVKHSLVC